MRKVILMMLLAAVSSSAMAEWVRVGSKENTTVYANPATIHKKENRVEMWNLLDYRTPQTDVEIKKPYLSFKQQIEYDCKEERLRILAVSWHAKNMGEGEVVDGAYTTGEQWSQISPKSIQDTLWKFACKKR